jgi:CRP/FNR family cyclic AMP-dependent transcriptional regulator
MYIESAGLTLQDAAGHRLDLEGPFPTMVSDLLRPQRQVRRPRAARSRAEAPTVGQAGWLKTLPLELQGQVQASMIQRLLLPGDLLLAPGERPAGWYGVLKGFLSVTHEGVGAPLLSSGLPRRAWYGEHLLLADRKCDCRLVACIPTLVVTLPQATFQRLLQHLEFCRFVMDVQTQRLLALRERLVWPRGLGTNGRVALRIAGLFDSELLFQGEFGVELTQSALSAFLGLSRQRTNSALKQLERVGEIDLEYGGVRVRNPQRLAQRALAGEIA